MPGSGVADGRSTRRGSLLRGEPGRGVGPAPARPDGSGLNTTDSHADVRPPHRRWSGPVDIAPASAHRPRVEGNVGRPFATLLARDFGSNPGSAKDVLAAFGERGRTWALGRAHRIRWGPPLTVHEGAGLTATPA